MPKPIPLGIVLALAAMSVARANTVRYFSGTECAAYSEWESTTLRRSNDGCQNNIQTRLLQPVELTLLLYFRSLETTMMPLISITSKSDIMMETASRNWDAL